MALEFKIAKLEDVAEAFRSLYVRNADGTFQLEVNGAVDKTKLDEFRQKNIDLLKEAEKYKNLDPTKYAELMELQRKREEKELLDAGEVDKVIENRVTAMKAEYEKAQDLLKTNNAQMTRQLETLMIDNTVRAAATKTGVRPEAVDDILLRAKSVFRIHEGQVVSLDGEGKVVYGKDGKTPLGIDEWSGNLKTVAPHLYLGSNAGGSQLGSGHGRTQTGDKLTGVGKIAAGIAAGGFDGDA